MIHAHDTHVLIDETGTAVLSGSEPEMRAAEAELFALGHDRIAVRRIDEPGNWDWTAKDWGD